ncbi:MAG: hypothetical protein Q4G62_09745 [Pseudomonadota bacterium]|nr:hypothetical protein [Pseudomonadota bacterium]
MTPQLTAEEAISLLRQQPLAYQTPEQLRVLAGQVDANPSGRITVLYSGPSAKGVESSQIIKSMLETGEDIRVINTSEAAKLLQSREFLNSVAKAYDVPARPLIDGTYRGPATEWLYHPTQGPWADASARFADATVGEVRTIVGDADPGRVFGATEVPRILANPNVTTIEGIPREALLARQASHGPQAAFEMVVANSREHVARLRVPVDTPVNHAGALLRDTYGELKLDSREYFSATQLEGKPPAFITETRPLASNMHPPTQHARSGAAHVEAWQVERIQGAAMRAPAIGGRALHATSAAGVALMAYDFVDTGHRVVQLRAQGNEVGADSAQTHFIGRNAGGALGGFLLGAGYGAATGSWTGPGAIATGVIGGIGGAYLGDRWAEQQDTARIYSQTDRSGNPWTRQPDDPQGIWSRTERTPTPTGGYQETRLVAGGRLHDELNYRAANDSYALGLANPPKPQAPFRLDASASTQPARSPYETGRDYVRDAHSGQWQLEISQNIEGRLPVTRHEPVSAEQANALELQSQAIIAQNAANTPAAVAARHQIAFEQFKWGDFTAHEPISPAIIHARTQTQTLQASDGNTYSRNPDGEWSRPGLLYGSHQAQGNLREELSRTGKASKPACKKWPRWRKWHAPTQPRPQAICAAKLPVPMHAPGKSPAMHGLMRPRPP